MADGAGSSDQMAAELQRCEHRIHELTAHIAALTTSITALHERLVADSATPRVGPGDLAQLATRVEHSVDARLIEHARRLGHAMVRSATLDGGDAVRPIDNPIFVGFDDQ